MECASLKRSLVRECKGIFILLLAFIILMGVLMLLLAAMLSLGTWVPALIPLVSPGQTFVTGSFLAILHYPLVFLIIVVLGGYIIQRFGWDTWL
ncbi:MAG: hypothetical protein WC586_01355 [Methanoregula sp.]